MMSWSYVSRSSKGLNHFVTSFLLVGVSIFVGLFVSLGAGCSAKQAETSTTVNVIQKGDRALGFHVTQSASGTYTEDFTQAERTGFDSVNLHFFWGVGNYGGSLPGTPLETNSSSGCGSASSYDMSNLAAAWAFYPARSKKVALTIATYDGPNKLVPQCAAALPFNSTTVKTMFHYLLDNIFATINASPQLELQSLVIGNEIDANSDLTTCAVSPALSTAWAAYKDFFENQMAYAKTKRSGLKVGVTGTLYGLIDPAKQPCYSQLAQNADFISATYYPLNSDFTMKDPSVVEGEIDSLVAAYPGKVIYLQEAGYSSGSSYVGSSESKQSLFYQNLFSVWDKHSTVIKYVSILNLHEWSASSVNGYGTLYGVCPGTYCNSFKEYLQTLGVRTYAGHGADKNAFSTIEAEAHQRGW